MNRILHLLLCIAFTSFIHTIANAQERKIPLQKDSIINSINTAYAQLEKSIEDQYAKLKKECRDKIDELTKKIKDVKDEIEELRRQIDKLEAMAERMEKELDKVLAHVGEDKQNALNKVKKAISENKTTEGQQQAQKLRNSIERIKQDSIYSIQQRYKSGA